MDGAIVFMGALMLSIWLVVVWTAAAGTEPRSNVFLTVVFPWLWLLVTAGTTVTAFIMNGRMPVSGGVLLVPLAGSLLLYTLFLVPRLLRGTVSKQAEAPVFITRTRRLNSFVGVARYFEARVEYLALMRVLHGAELSTVRRAFRDTRGLHLDKVYEEALPEFFRQFTAGGWPADARELLSDGLDDIQAAIRKYGGKTVRGYLALGLPLDAAAAAMEAGIPLEYAAAMGLPKSPDEG